nr:MAG TPA: hypothetical protein [Caudoviricetes sp.]
MQKASLPDAAVRLSFREARLRQIYPPGESPGSRSPQEVASYIKHLQ